MLQGEYAVVFTPPCKIHISIPYETHFINILLRYLAVFRHNNTDVNAMFP